MNCFFCFGNFKDGIIVNSNMICNICAKTHAEFLEPKPTAYVKPEHQKEIKCSKCAAFILVEARVAQNGLYTCSKCGYKNMNVFHLD